MITAGEQTGAKREWPITALVFATITTGLVAILANLLNFHNYPVARPEIALLLVALVLTGAAAAGIHRLAQPRLSFVFTGLFVAILIDLGADLDRLVILSIACAISLLAWFGERVVLKLTAAAFGSVLLFQLADIVTSNEPPKSLPNEAKRLQAPSPGGEKLPPIIHLMLDSYMGLDGMSAPNTNFGDLRQQQQRFYLSHGFQVYPQAYSRHAKTVNSMPEFLSYGQAKRATTARNVQFTVAAPLNYFIDLDRKGYRTSVMTPSFVDLCPNQPLTLCRNYNRSDLSSLAGSSLSVWDRAHVIGQTMMDLSVLTILVSATINFNLDILFDSDERHIFNRAKLYSLTGFRQLDDFSRDLSTLRHGEARFVHLLIPHDPYLMDAKCNVLPEPEWVDEHGPVEFAKRDAAYARQTRCMTEHGLNDIMNRLAQTEAGRDAIVIIQGDHGARTVNGVPGADGPRPDHRSMTVTHSAFFAIRVPGQPGGEVSGRYALDELIGGFAATGFAGAPRPVAGPAEVFLMDVNWVPAKRVPLAPFIPELRKN
jgi:hypothetical protein